MIYTSKLFMNGRSQAVRLPASCRFDCKEVFIHKDAQTGDIIISKKPGSWDSFFKLTEDLDIEDDFMLERANEAMQERNLF